jgi:hypothetical protein
MTGSRAPSGRTTQGDLRGSVGALETAGIGEAPTSDAACRPFSQIRFPRQGPYAPRGNRACNLQTRHAGRSPLRFLGGIGQEP